MNPILLYKSIFETGTLSATDTDADPIYNVLNIKDGRTSTFWKGLNTTTPKYVKVQCGTYLPADTLLIKGHNFGTIGAEITFQYSTDNFVADINDAVAAFSPADDLMIVKTFTMDAVVDSSFIDTGDGAFIDTLDGAWARDAVDWRIKIDGTLSAAPEFAVAMADMRITFPYPLDTPVDPYNQGIVGKMLPSNTGEDLGASVRFHPVKLDYKWSQLKRSFITDTIKPFWDTHGRKFKRFLFAPDLDNLSDAIYWARLINGARFKMPLSMAKYVDSLTLNMEAVAEE